MKHSVIVGVLAAGLMVSSCKKNETTTGPSSEAEFPASGKFAVTLYTPKSTVAVNETFIVKAVLYNVTNVFGGALEVGYASAKVQVQSASVGAALFGGTNVLTLSQIEPDSQRVSFGVTFKAGVSTGATGSGVMVNFQCKALTAGSAVFTINTGKLELKQSDGTAITNFNSILKENLTVTVQ